MEMLGTWDLPTRICTTSTVKFARSLISRFVKVVLTLSTVLKVALSAIEWMIKES